jgi:RNA polymerase sigma-70 factor (ECF subfamily)
VETLKDIWEELGTKVRRFVGARVNDAHAADDIAQDVLLKVQGQLGSLPAEEKLPAWVFTVARNAVVDYYRARAVRDHAGVADVHLLGGREPDDAETAVRELAPCLSKMIELLPEPYRGALKSADIDQVPHQELADRSGITLTAAKSRVRRGRQQLREMILDCCDVDRDARGGVMNYQTTDRSARYCGGADDDCGKPRGCGG